MGRQAVTASQRRLDLEAIFAYPRRANINTQNRTRWNQEQNRILKKQSETQSNDEPGPCDTTTGCQPCTITKIGQQLVVKMNFNQNGHGMKRKIRKTKSLSRASKKIKTLEVKLKALGTRNNALRKRVQRLKDKLDKFEIEQKDCFAHQRAELEQK